MTILIEKFPNNKLFLHFFNRGLSQLHDLLKKIALKIILKFCLGIYWANDEYLINFVSLLEGKTKQKSSLSIILRP
jgi:hypothetical protein